jgi:hypothetical protein
MVASPGRVMAAGVLWLTLAAGLPARAQDTLAAHAQPALADVSADVKVVSHNDRELEKMGKGYSQAYTLEHQRFFWKAPGEARFQARKGVIQVLRITNGSRQMSEITGLAVLRKRMVEDVEQKPGKADTIVDLGAITPAWVRNVESRCLRVESRDGHSVEVFNFWYRNDPGSVHALWIDRATHTVVEHVIYVRGQATRVKKRIVYADVRQLGEVRLPTSVSVYNAEGKLAAQMRYDGLRVNQGLQDKLFTF